MDTYIEGELKVTVTKNGQKSHANPTVNYTNSKIEKESRRQYSWKGLRNVR